MKNIFLLALVLLAYSCKNEKSSNQRNSAIPNEAVYARECYLGLVKNDTISLMVNRKGNQVTGTLRYNFLEKDDNFGEFSGVVKGDTLLANYTFMSEGVASVREVAFLKKGNNYSEGYGETNDDNQGNVTFKNPTQIRFDGKIALSPVSCE